MPLADRLAAGVVITDDGCWEWTGNRNQYGYGRISINNRKVSVHRLVYEIATGTGAPRELDHLCCNRACCNPAHLEPVTHAENMARTRRDVCRRGHDRPAGERCLVCDRSSANLRYRLKTLGAGRIRLAGEVVAPEAMIESGIYPFNDDTSDGLLVCRLSDLHEVVAAIAENWEASA